MTFTVLLVCTGNICRSALAERLGRAYLDERLGPEAETIRLVSAGTRAVVGSGMHPDTALVLQGFGAEAGDFRAQQLNDSLIDAADLTLAMTRAHRRDVLERAPRSLARTFTLREAAALLAGLDRDVAKHMRSPADRARAFVAALAAERARRPPGDDDVPDPINRALEVHEEVGDLVVSALLPILSRLADLAVPTEGDSSVLATGGLNA